MEINIHFEEGG